MYCSQCGAEASGNFCAKCGSALQGGNAAAPPPVDWSREVRYETLTRIPEVRETIKRHAAMAKKALSGEEFLAWFDKVVPLGISVQKLGSAVVPIYERLGIKTGKERAETLTCPPATAIVATLCSLARHGQTLRQVQQFEDGCLLEAALPSDAWSFEGTLYVTLRAAGTGTRVEGATTIKGQWFDWGKSKRCLEALFADLKNAPA